MNKRIKTMSIFMAAALMSSVAFGQESKDKLKKTETQEEIIIRKKGDKTEKTTIVIDGDKVTVNGKPLADYKGDDISIRKMRQSGGLARAYSPRPRIAMGPDMDLQGFENFAPAMVGNKAVLGVTTEKAEDGVKVTGVTDESGAAKAGLKKDDVITKVGDAKIETPADLVEAIGKYKPEDKVDLVYTRSGKENKVSATLGENKMKAFSFNMPEGNFNFQMPDRPMAPSLNGSMFAWNRKPKIGLQIQDVEEGKGAKVNEVDEDSPASKSGFKEGDVITEVNGKAIDGVDDLKKEISDLKEGDSVKINFKREGKSQSAEIKIPKRLKTADL